MRKLVVSLSLGILVAGSLTSSFACGDKLLALGKGVRLQRAYSAARPASLLIYVGANTGKSGLGNSQLQSSLKQAGHKLVTVADVAMLDQDLKSSKFDLLLVDYSDALALAERVKANPAKAMIVPVMGKANKAEIAAATKQFGYLVKSDANPVEFLMAIDQAMKSRSGSRS